MSIIANRFNSQKVIEVLTPYGCNMPITRRWQVSFLDNDGQHRDYYFVCKPTKRQLRAIK